MEIIVSVLTTAYNHKPFIAQTIESIVTQKTDFPFELIIHDDASTDGTADIIREYAEKYPDIIRPIYQTENQYSKGVDVYSFMDPLIRGKYVAQCEGDDMWCDDRKLQMQVDFLENHAEYVACVHNTKFVNMQTNEEKIRYSLDQERDLNFTQLIAGGSSCYHTSSLMWRANIDITYPVFAKEDLLIGSDYIFSLFLSLQGKIRYFPNVMSIYRFLTPGSWTWRNSQSQDKVLKVFQDGIYFLTEMNKYTNFQYTELIDKLILKKKFQIAEEKFEFSMLKRGELRNVYTNLSMTEKIKINIKQWFRPVYIFYRQKKRENLVKMAAFKKLEG